MTTAMKPRVEAMKRCPRCRCWKERSEFSRDKDASDGLQWWCKSCMREYRQSHPAQKGLPPQKMTLDEKWEELSKRVPEEIKQHLGDLSSSDPLVRARAQQVQRERNERLKVWNDRFYGALAKERKELAKQRALARIDRLVKAVVVERGRSETIASLAKAKAVKVAAEADLANSLTAQRLAENELAEVMKSAEDLAMMMFKVEQDALQYMADIEGRIDVVTRNAEAGQRAIEQNRCRINAAAEARAEREAAEWLFKANSTSDPTLRAAYLARAEGRDVNDDDCC